MSDTNIDKENLIADGRSGGNCFRVEARSKDGEGIKVGEQMFAGNWKAVDFKQTSGCGVSMKYLEPALKNYGMMDYSAAKALQLWLLHEMGVCSLETRISAFEYQSTLKITRKGHEDELDWSHVRYTGK